MSHDSKAFWVGALIWWRKLFHLIFRLLSICRLLPYGVEFIRLSLHPKDVDYFV